MTIDEDLSVLEDHVRRLKVEYDIYFGGGSKKPPADIEWKVKNLLKKHSDGSRMNFGQRFRYNTVQQRYALYNALWQQKLQIKEEGYRRPQDAILGIQGLRDEQQHEAELARKHEAVAKKSGHFSIGCANPDSELTKVEALFQVLGDARRQNGDKNAANLQSFKKFVRQKTEQLRKEYDCKTVEYSVEVQDGQVKLKAKPKS
ncbi:MAG TPA: MXAN_5187 C-terminal domain-containing protein [Candidatus Angelobacter sp.]